MAANKVELIAKASGASGTADIENFRIGDMVDVHIRVKEGEKERIQVFNGLIIGRKGHGSPGTFTVRRVIGSEGIERIFPFDCPSLVAVKVVRKGKVRKSKLYYMRGRLGKKARITERRDAISPKVAAKQKKKEEAKGEGEE